MSGDIVVANAPVSGDIAVANAPVSYGAFELTVGHDPDVPDGITVLDQVAAAGYAGIDLGPVGYLGSGERLGELLAERRLGLAGAYVELPYADRDALERALPDLDAILDAFDAVRSYLPGPPPRPTLADNGSQARRNRPGRSVRDPSLGFDADAWQRFAAGLARVISRCRDRGYEPTFHPETGTHVEAPWEIERVLEVSDVGLCLETGHMLLGGGDPVAIGAGRMGRTHLRALAGSDRVRVAAVAEMSPAARAAVDAPGAELYESTAEMLDRAALDGVLIAAPTDQHSAIIAQVAARGVPILCEKPCGLSAAAARASAQVGVPLQVAYWRRFGPGRGAAAV